MIVNITGVGSTGETSDITPNYLPSNAWTSASNIRFFNGSAQTILKRVNVLETEEYTDAITDYFEDGNDYVTEPLAGMSTDYGQALIGFVNSAGANFAYATADQLFVYTGGHHLNYTNPVNTNVVSSTEWNSVNFNNCIIFSNPDSIPQILLPNASTYVDMPAWDGIYGSSTQWFAERICAFKNFIIALNTTEDGDNFKQRVRWSNAAEPNTAPVDWDATDVNSLAGFNDLSDATGSILTGMTLNDTFYVYTTKEIFAVSYVGGTNIFSFRKISGSINLMNPNCVLEYKNQHVLMTRDNIYAFNGVNTQSIVDGKTRDKIFQQINVEYKDNIKIINNSRYNEVWFLFPSKKSASGHCDKAAVWNSLDNTWSFRTFKDEITSINVVQKPAETGLAWDDFTGTTWDSYTQPWEVADYGTDVLMSICANGLFYLNDQVPKSSEKQTAILERKYLDFDDFGLETTSIKKISSIYPQFNGEGKISISVGTSEYINGEVTWETAQTFEIGKDNRLDFRTSGRYFSIRFSCTDVNAVWRLSNYALEIDQRFKGRHSQRGG